MKKKSTKSQNSGAQSFVRPTADLNKDRDGTLIVTEYNGFFKRKVGKTFAAWIADTPNGRAVLANMKLKTKRGDRTVEILGTDANPKLTEVEHEV